MGLILLVGMSLTNQYCHENVNTNIILLAVYFIVRHILAIVHYVLTRHNTSDTKMGSHTAVKYFSVVCIHLMAASSFTWILVWRHEFSFKYVGRHQIYNGCPYYLATQLCLDPHLSTFPNISLLSKQKAAWVKGFSLYLAWQ